MKIENYMKEKDYITIPSSWMPTHFYTISFQGWGEFTFVLDDPTLSEMTNMATRTLDYFIRMYKDEKVFTEPEISWKPDGTFCVKIGTLEKEEYERRTLEKKTVKENLLKEF